MDKKTFSIYNLKISFGFLHTILICFLCSVSTYGQDSDERGIYLAKKTYDGKEIPTFLESKDKLPKPIMQKDSQWIDMYWKCWEIAFEHFKRPSENSVFVSNILDEAFNENIFQWDMIFMVMFARYGNHVFPAVESLDNFYCRQHKSGYICRELNEISGEDFVLHNERSNTINPPLFSWAEIESSKNTGDYSRFKLVLPVLEKYVEWLNKPGTIELGNDSQNWNSYGRKAMNSKHTLFWNTGLGSGMDNTPRGGNGWVDMSCQMVIQYKNLSYISEVLGKHEKAAKYSGLATKIANEINKYCWSEKDGLYYDVDSDGKHIKWKTVGCFWPMLAEVASTEQSKRLVEHLTDTTSFWRKNVFPTLAADQDLFSDKGDYWRGGVWAPTNYMIIKGLEKYNHERLATEASMKYLNALYCVFKSTNTVWENYSSEYCAPGEPAKPNFVGWTGIGPISLLIENILGFRVNAIDNTLIWHIKRDDEHGIKNLKVGETSIDALFKKQGDSSIINFTTNRKIKLIIHLKGKKKEYNLNSGHHKINI